MGGAGAVLTSGAVRLEFNGSGALMAMAAGAARIAVSARVLSYQTAEKTENSWDFSTNGNGGGSAKAFAGERTQSATLTAGKLFSELRTTVDAAAGITIRYRLYAGAEHAHIFVSSGPFDVTHHVDQVSPGRYCRSTLSLTVIGRHSLGIYTVVLLMHHCCHCYHFLSK